MNPIAVPTSPGAPRRSVDLSAVPVCARHGEPAVRRVDWRPQWRPLRPGDLEIAGGIIGSPFGYRGRVLERIAQTVAVDAASWPLCSTCAGTRARWVGSSRALFALGVLCVLGSVVVGLATGGRPVLALLLAVGFVLVLVSTVPLALGSLERITGARSNEDGSMVLVQGADDRFRRAVAGGAGPA